MTRYLLDTNILSELRRTRPEKKVLSFVSAQALENLFVSVVTFAEIRFGIELVEDIHKRTELNSWLNLTLRPMFSERQIPVSEDVMLQWRLLVEQGRKIGHTYSQPDLIIAATALTHGLTIVSRDTNGYEKTGVAFINPWLA